MKTIVIDHIRRWWWLWLFSCVGCGWIVGFGRPLKPDLSNAWFPVAMYLGVVQLSQDLQRGDVLHVLRAMPVSAKQIGRAWWWASVGVPALVLALITGLMFACSSFFGSQPVSLIAGFNFWLSNALLLGALFFFESGMPALGSLKTRTPRGWGCLFSLLFGASFFVMIYFYRLFPAQTTSWDCFVAVASILTVAGWFRAEMFAREQLGNIIRPRDHFRNLARSFPGMNLKSTHSMNGRGGLRFLFQTQFVNLALMGLSMVVIGGGVMILTSVLTGALKGNEMLVNTITIGFTTQIFAWLICWQTVRAALHLRCLRTLPVTTMKLAGVFILAPATAMLVIFCFASLVFAAIFPNASVSPLAMLRAGSLLQIALALTVVPLVVWRGFDLFGFVVVMLVVIGGPISSIFVKKHFPTAANLAVSLLVVFGCFLVTKLLLERSSTTYRPRRNQFAGRQFGVGS